MSQCFSLLTLAMIGFTCDLSTEVRHVNTCQIRLRSAVLGIHFTVTGTQPAIQYKQNRVLQL